MAKPTCSTCPFFEKFGADTNDGGCKYEPPKYTPMGVSAYPRVSEGDGACGKHPEKLAQYGDMVVPLLGERVMNLYELLAPRMTEIAIKMADQIDAEEKKRQGQASA